MEFITSTFSSILTFASSINYSPLKQLIDLNDARNLATIIVAFFGVKAALKKWGNSAIYSVMITSAQNRPTRPTNLTIANLKDKPLVIYRVIASFKGVKAYVTLQEFSTPLVIDGLKAAPVQLDPYSSLQGDNPFEEIWPKMDIWLVTESSAVKCKPAKHPQHLVNKTLKGFKEITKSIVKFNSKIYSDQAKYAITYRYNDKDCTSFLLKGGYICDDWPFPINSIDVGDMESEESVTSAIKKLSVEIKSELTVNKLMHF